MRERWKFLTDDVLRAAFCWGNGHHMAHLMVQVTPSCAA